jgi:lysophospholipase L1-like esterase
MLDAGRPGGAGARRTAVACLALACLVGLTVVPAAATADGAAEGTAAKADVGQVRMTAPVDGRSALLVPVRYPIQLLGQPLELRLILRRPGRGGAIHGWRLRVRANGGDLRLPERRRRFTFVHRIPVGPQLTRQLQLGVGTGRHRGRARPLVQVEAPATLDVNRDGVPELDSIDRELHTLPRRYAGRRLCASTPLLRTRPGRRVAVRLPRCGARVRWRIARRPAHGSARIHGGELIYRSAQRFRGADSVRLRQRRGRGAGSSARGRSAPVEIRVVRRDGIAVRAIGDSVTAGFGYYDDGSLMPFTSLLACKPAERFYDDACSSNSTSRSNEEDEVHYAPDYGLSNNVSWAAQWSNEHNVTNYENLAVTGSEPSDWLPGGQLYSTLQRMESEEPDYILMTMGANPLLSEMLFGIDHMGCAIWSDVFGRYRECIEEAFAGVHLRESLERLYEELADGAEATIYLMQYHLSVPASALAYSATQIAMMGAMLNAEIASAAAEVGSPQLHVIAPPHFDVGVDISPVYPSNYSCSHFGYRVDGPSVQSEPTQDELLLSHPLSFCSGPPEGPPWVISGDTGIHPSAAGYAQMASRAPAP